MRKKIEKTAGKYVEFIKQVGIQVVQPFKERPSVDQEVTDPATVRQPKPNDDYRLCATDLFSIFTADIIKKEVIFIR